MMSQWQNHFYSSVGVKHEHRFFQMQKKKEKITSNGLNMDLIITKKLDTSAYEHK